MILPLPARAATVNEHYLPAGGDAFKAVDRDRFLAFKIVGCFA